MSRVRHVVQPVDGAGEGGRVSRVLHVAQPVDGGVARVVEDLAAGEQAEGLDVWVASPRGELAERLAARGLAWRYWPAQRRPDQRVAKEAVALAGLVAELRPDVVHLHSSKAGLAGRLALRLRTPTIFQPHGWSWQAGGAALAAVSIRWERFAARWATAVVCVSEAERRAGELAGLTGVMTVIPNGVDLATFSLAGPAQRVAARESLGLPVEAPVALCVGRLDAQKDQAVLIEGWPQVRQRVPAALLVLAGVGPRRAALGELARARGVAAAVRFVGHRGDVAACYAAADVVALSSRWGEAMALTPLEAMATGRPVVASDVAGVRESLPAGAGAVVPPGDVAGFARELSERLLDPALARREGDLGRGWVAARFSLPAMLAAHLRLVRRLGAQASSGAGPAGPTQAAQLP